jgi:hypothetical protein
MDYCWFVSLILMVEIITLLVRRVQGGRVGRDLGFDRCRDVKCNVSTTVPAFENPPQLMTQTTTSTPCH